MHLRFRFRNFQARILLFFLGLFALVQVGTMVAVTTANYHSTNQKVRLDLRIAGRVFEEFLQERVDRLTLDAQLVSGDFAFKQAFADGDRGTLYSAVTNLQQRRVGADLMMVTDAEDYAVSIDTLAPDQHGQDFPFPELIEEAEDSGEPSTAVVELGPDVYRLILVPLLAPEPIAWIAIGFLIDDRLAQNLKALTLTDVSFLIQQTDGVWRVAASSLPDNLREAFSREVAEKSLGLNGSANLSVGEERFIALGRSPAEHMEVVLMRSLDQALEPFQRLYHLLLLLTAASLTVTAVVGVFIARTVTRPVRALVASAKRVEMGDYQHRTQVTQDDELGRLAEAFNQMTRGLAAFQRYVPTDLVRRLISEGIESRPEVRLATMLFTDIEGFTALGEALSPEQLVAVLNEYFSVVTGPIEKHGGVIIQYQGDAMLAVFNIPAVDPNHAINAVRAAIEIQSLLKHRSFSGGIHIRTRIGINTGQVVAASVGSKDRVNFTVHGDAVNLAARVEALNKDYNTSILITQETAVLLGEEFRPEPVGEAQVRGKQRPVTVFSIPVQRIPTEEVA